MKQQYINFEKSHPSFHSVDLYIGNVTVPPTHTFSCFFIVEHIYNNDYIEKIAKKLLVSDCRHFEFWGAQGQHWENVFDTMDMLIHPKFDKDSIALTTAWQKVSDLVESLDLQMSLRSIVPHDVYVFYDDERLYEDVLRQSDAF